MGQRTWLLLLPPLLLWSRGNGLTEQDCEDATFFNSAINKCTPCKKCEGIREYKQRCLKTTDAICLCRAHYRCGEKDECKKCPCESGEQWTEEGCQPCPDGTFNNKNGSECQSWTKCPDNKILENGTRMTDVRCRLVTEGTMTTSTTPSGTSPEVKESGSQLLTISIALTVTLLLCVLSLLIVTIAFRAWAQRKLLAVFVKQPLGQLAPEVDDCSCRYPEEEEGGGEGLKGELLEKYP